MEHKSLHEITFWWIVAILSVAAFWLIGHMKMQKREESKNIKSVQFTCAEFTNTEARNRFDKTGIIAAGTQISNKNGRDCHGVPIANNP